MNSITDTQMDALAAPFNPEYVFFRVTNVNEEKGVGRIRAELALEAIYDRLDEAIGRAEWGYDLEPVLTKELKGDVIVKSMKGKLIIGGVPRGAIGIGNSTRETEVASFKAAAVMWGVGRYLEQIRFRSVPVEKRGDRWIIVPDAEQRTREEFLGQVFAPEPTGEEDLDEDEDVVPAKNIGEALVLFSEAITQSGNPIGTEDSEEALKKACYYYLKERVGVAGLPSFEAFDTTRCSTPQLAILTSAIRSNIIGWTRTTYRITNQ